MNTKTRHYTSIDSHVHLDLILHDHPDRIQWLDDRECRVVSWAFFSGLRTTADLADALDRKARTIGELSRNRLTCRYLAGVHPRSIPSGLRPEQIPALLTPYLDDPLCLGIGEIGLETGAASEEEVFIAQLELGRSLENSTKVIGVHTPRSNKVAMTEKTLQILGGFSDLAPRLVVDHTTVDTIADVLDAGFWAGVTLSPAKTSWDEMKRIAAAHADQIHRIMCNTDSGSEFYEDVVQYRASGDLPEEIRAKLFHDNAAQFYSSFR